MSITASFVILFILIMRLFLKKVPKIFSYALWSVVLFRLICPISFESVFSLIPTKTEAIPQNIMYARTPQINTGISILDQTVNSSLPAPIGVTSINPMQVVLFLARILWVLGFLVLVSYSILSLISLKQKLKDAVFIEDNIYSSNRLDTPFVMGIIRPRIYLPANLTAQERRYILLHEQTHIKRCDHLIKILSFLALCIHWFNPLVWLAFFVSGKDMEMSCDESVIKTLGSEVKKEYSTSLLSLSTGKRILGGTPLAFGEGDTKGRIKNILNYKKTPFWVLMVCILAVILTSISLIANPKEEEVASIYLKVENLQAILMQQPDEAIQIRENTRKVFQYLSSEGIGTWINDTEWTKQGSASVNELQPTYVLENLQGEEIRSEIRLYQSETTLAMVVYGDESCYYRIDPDAFKRFELLILPISYAVPFDEVDMAAVITEYKKGKIEAQVKVVVPTVVNRLSSLLLVDEAFSKPSINDIPKVKEYIQIVFQSSNNQVYHYLYEEDGEYSLEISYQGIWKISSEAVEEIRAIMEESDGTVDAEPILETNNTGVEEASTERVDDILERLFDTLENLSQKYSNINDLIQMNKDIFEEVISYGDSTLIYCFQRFELGNQTEEKGSLMMAACRRISVDEDIDLVTTNGQEWYDAFKENAIKMQTQLGKDEFKKHMPKAYLLTQYLSGNLEYVSDEIILPNYEYSGNDDVLKLVYETEKSRYEQAGTSKGFLIPAVYVHGSYDVDNQKKVFATIYNESYVLYGNQVRSVSGSIIPVAITFINQNQDGYTVLNYEQAKDGAMFQSSIEDFCTYPISGDVIPGLADEILDFYSNYEELLQLQRDNLIEHLNVNQLSNISLVREYDHSMIPLN